jgi:hypothetical protein
VAGPFTDRRSANLGQPLFFSSLGANQCGRNVLGKPRGYLVRMTGVPRPRFKVRDALDLLTAISM